MAVAPRQSLLRLQVLLGALCSFYATQNGLSSVSLRVGGFELADGRPLGSMRDLRAWLSNRDATHLIDRAIEAEIKGSFVA